MSVLRLSTVGAVEPFGDWQSRREIGRKERAMKVSIQCRPGSKWTSDLREAGLRTENGGVLLSRDS